MVHAMNNYSCPNVHALSMSTLYVYHEVAVQSTCYDSMPKVLSKELTLVLSDTRELDRVPSTE